MDTSEGTGQTRRPATGSPPEKILAVAYELFARRGIRDVGVDELIRASGVAKATFYRHFQSKDDVVLAFLEQWYQERTAAIEDAIARNGTRGEAAMLTVFDVFDDWFRQGAVQVSSFLHVMMEMGPDHPLGKASIQYLEKTREQIADLARSAGLDNPYDFSWSIHILIKGAIVAAAEGDPRAAARAKDMATLLIDSHRP
ncbi:MULTISPECIES: TetR/AcrR family transcriptional regulator [unclassified Arthrobacter]|uniref:TetR/AcrR family transcriptional regulator n=1 Tax=unclassified Arthrobacter TaxID=235627 RepID=UPI001F452A19|nr:TetR/AcrR family transcriptional regulator [Arthrobacter sp. FW305-BF8]UKA56265.1 TetR/AcrR family transcriptional regulator [Arthrobacter sp. FW305-BF8]